MNIPLLVVLLAAPYGLYYVEKRWMYPFYVSHSGRTDVKEPSIMRYHLIAAFLVIGTVLLYLGY